MSAPTETQALRLLELYQRALAHALREAPSGEHSFYASRLQEFEQLRPLLASGRSAAAVVSLLALERKAFTASSFSGAHGGQVQSAFHTFASFLEDNTSALPSVLVATRFAASVRETCSNFVLYEGLPHQFFESESLRRELGRNVHFELEGFPFYRETLEFRRQQKSEALALLSDPTIYDPFWAEALCGGFHPDFAVTCNCAGVLWTCQLCFGCREVKLFAPSQHARYCLADGAGNALSDLLKPQRKNRPPYEQSHPSHLRDPRDSAP